MHKIDKNQNKKNLYQNNEVFKIKLEIYQFNSMGLKIMILSKESQLNSKDSHSKKVHTLILKELMI